MPATADSYMDVVLLGAHHRGLDVRFAGWGDDEERLARFRNGDSWILDGEVEEGVEVV